MALVAQGPLVRTAASLPAAPTLSRNQYNIPTEVAQQNFLQEAAGLQTDEDKYNAATEMAFLANQDKESLSDDELKKEIDTYFEQLNPTKSGREMRGENAWTDFVGGAKGMIDSFNLGVGNVLDGAFDTVAGGLLDVVGAPKTANDVRGWFTGEDLALIPDVATDVALTASGVGIPVMLAKNAIQLSPQMAQAISGKDAVTLEDMDAGQRAANAALGFGGVLASAIPVIGKGVNVAKNASKSMATKELNQASKVLDASKALDDAVEEAAKGKRIPLESEPLKASDSLFANKQVQAAMDAAEEAGVAPGATAKLQDAADAAQANLDQGTFGRALGVIGQNATGTARGIADIPSVIRDTFNAQRNAKSLRGIAKGTNKTFSEGDDINKAFTAQLREEYNKLSDKGDMTFEDFAKDLGVRLKDGVATDLPVDEGKLKKAVKKKTKEHQRELSAGGEKRLKGKDLDEYQDLVREKAVNTIPLNPSGFKGRGPIRTLRTYGNAIGDNLLTKANRGAPQAIDQTAYMDALRNLQAEMTEGTAGNMMRAAGTALPLGRRALSMLGGFAPAVPAAVVGEMADTGGSLDEVFANLRNPRSMIPYFLTGSRGLARRTIPGLRGEVGRSNIPHNTMRGLAYAKNQVDTDESTENEGFAAALDNVRNKKKEEEE